MSTPSPDVPVVRPGSCKATEISRYYRWLTTKIPTKTKEFTARVPQLADDKLRLNEEFFVADVMQRITCFKGVNLPPVTARDSCLPCERVDREKFRVLATQGMCPTGHHDPGFVPAFFNAGGVGTHKVCALDKMGDSMRELHPLSATMPTIDFDKLASSCEPICELPLLALDFDKMASSCEPICELPLLPDETPTLGIQPISDTGMFTLSSVGELRYEEDTVRHDWSKNKKIKNTYDAFRSAWKNNNETIGSGEMDSLETAPALLQSSRALVDTILEERHTVPKLLALTAMAKIADLSMLSLVVVLDSLAEVRETTCFLRENITFKNRPLKVCEFLVGAFLDDGFTMNRTRTIECERQTRVDLRETLKDRGIVVCLRRADVLSNLHDELASIKKQRHQSPGNTICYTDAVTKFNASTSLLRAAYTLTQAMKKDIDCSVMALVRRYVPPPPPVVAPPPPPKSAAPKRKALKRKFSAASRKTADVQATTCANEAAVRVDDDPLATWEAWEYSEEDGAQTRRSKWWRPKISYADEGLDAEIIACIRADIKTSFEWCKRYGQTLIAERERLLAIEVPNCVGLMLAMECGDADDVATKGYIDALSGRHDPDRAMIVPHCTVLLSHEPIGIQVSI